MSHHIYQTDGFILKSREAKDANRFYQIFTRDLGLIGASAQGVRLLKSKLRYSLHSFAYSHLSLVRGREVWRITSAGRIENIYKDLGPETPQPERFLLVERIFSLLDRLLTGEEKNEPLFEAVLGLINFLKIDEAKVDKVDSALFSADELRSIETISVMRILYFLGYFS
ncbi:MAG: recombination protein O N-terminal domain-containing protein, partial [Candidatus Pacebacteria bacterium]|nr:recombination protein O N-terminal domain-containing protein [Candidatus Paceibacterota bacterium]